MAIRLGKLIKLLECEPQDHGVCFDFGGLIPRKIDSYRGYYDQLALGYDEDWSKEQTVAGLLDVLREVRGKTLTGYKGGEYLMGDDTPVWAANYGECHSTAIVGLADCGWRTILATQFQDS